MATSSITGETQFFHLDAAYISYDFQRVLNRPLYSYVLSCQAYDLV